MTIALIIVGIAGWALCGFLAYGRTLADFQRMFPELADQDRNADRARAWFVALCGPLGLVVGLIGGRHGWMWRLPPRHEL